MAKLKHTTTNSEGCSLCITNAQRDAMFGRSYLDQMALTDKYAIEHKKALARRERAEAYRDAGMVKVQGALGGTYWE